MSDGPYRSLNMEKVWKDLAKAIHYPANTALDRIDAFTKALDHDFKKDVTNRGLELIVGAFTGEAQPDMFNKVTPESLEFVRSLCPPSGLLDTLIDNAKVSASLGKVGEDGLHDAMTRSLEDYCACRSRQVEEHYLRKAEDGETTVAKSRAMRRDFDGLMNQNFIASIASRLINWGKTGRPEKVVRSLNGLDDGPGRVVLNVQ